MTGKDEKTESNRLDPWIEPDGNIVLAAQGKYFRVHRGVLCNYSEVFRDLFNASDPPSNEEQEEFIDNCPVIHLYDAASDLQAVLKAMYDRSYPVPYYMKIPLSIVAAFLRLGEKYAIEQILTEGKTRLCCAYESTLDVAARISASRTIQLFQGITDGDPYDFQIMNLLEEMDLRAPLPLAMFQCVVTCPLTTILDGYEYKGVTYTLSQENIRSAMLLKDIMESFRLGLAQGLRISKICTTPTTCISFTPRLFSNDAIVKQPFSPWRNEWDKLFCSPCRQGIFSGRNAAIQAAWNQIPTIFGFASWAEITKNKDFPSMADAWYTKVPKQDEPKHSSPPMWRYDRRSPVPDLFAGLSLETE